MTAGVYIILALVSLGPFVAVLWILEFRRRKRVEAQAKEQVRGFQDQIKRLQDQIGQLEDEQKQLRHHFAPVTDMEAEVGKLQAEATSIRSSIEEVRATYAEKRKYLDELEKQIAIYDERMAFAELGVYEPHFDFKDTEKFKAAIEKVRAAQKQLITGKKAADCPAKWTVEGSEAKGQMMINRQTRLTLRAFNAECDAAISNARWNNVIAMEKRIISAYTLINKENSSLKLTITDEYLSLKLEELSLTHEYRELQKSEKEERAELARAEREEKKLLAQAEAAEREEQKYQALLDKAKAEADATTGGMTSAMAKRIAELEKTLAEAHDASERAKAMAEMTKSGYVYIISNVGSFGENVVKIGLTRRLDPDDRIRELGDASVPFSFDVHAMVYSDEAPTLESALHREFADRRINLTNFRKEFFSVALDEVEAAVARLAPTASFFRDREAQEWHETLAKRNQVLVDMKTPAKAFPAAI